MLQYLQAACSRRTALRSDQQTCDGMSLIWRAIGCFVLELAIGYPTRMMKPVPCFLQPSSHASRLRCRRRCSRQSRQRVEQSRASAAQQACDTSCTVHFDPGISRMLRHAAPGPGKESAVPVPRLHTTVSYLSVVLVVGHWLICAAAEEVTVEAQQSAIHSRSWLFATSPDFYPSNVEVIEDSWKKALHGLLNRWCNSQSQDHGVPIAVRAIVQRVVALMKESERTPDRTIALSRYTPDWTSCCAAWAACSHLHAWLVSTATSQDASDASRLAAAAVLCTAACRCM